MVSSPINTNINKFGLYFASLILILSSGTSFSQVLIWQEDFVNGLASVNGAWTTSGPDPDWEHSFVGAIGEFSNGEAIASTTSSNGFMLFNADGLNTDPISTTPRVGILTSPTIDLSEEASVVLQYQSYFRYCCAEGDAIKISVSGNDGSSWTDYVATNGVTMNASSQNPLIHQLDISTVAARQSHVRIRFTFGNGIISHYHWQIDDVEIFNQAVDCDGADATLVGENISIGQTVTCNDGDILVQDLVLDGTLIINKTGETQLQAPISIFGGGILEINKGAP